jgi:hypothetical protein
MFAILNHIRWAWKFGLNSYLNFEYVSNYAIYLPKFVTREKNNNNTYVLRTYFGLSISFRVTALRPTGFA